MPSVRSITLGFEPWGFAANILLFFPLGLALRELGILQSWRRAAALSIAVEAVQFFLEARHP
jgi:glycopeptide antibiotics resistance protein